jgi:hypothetical protein
MAVYQVDATHSIFAPSMGIGGAFIFDPGSVHVSSKSAGNYPVVKSPGVGL